MNLNLCKVAKVLTMFLLSFLFAETFSRRVPDPNVFQEKAASLLALDAEQNPAIYELHNHSTGTGVDEIEIHGIFHFKPEDAQRLIRVRGNSMGLRRLISSRHPVPTRVTAYVDLLADQALRSRAGYNAYDQDRSPPDEVQLDYDDITPDLLLNVFYPTYRDQYPHVLTYRPRVDCHTGRYLILGVNDSGFGTTTESYFLKILYTLYTNMTGVHVPFPNGHLDEPSCEQDEFWRFNDWEVTQADIDACPLESPVRRNVLDLTHRTEDVGAMHDEIVNFASSLYWNGLGGSIRLVSAGLFSHRDEMKRDFFLRSQWLLELRWNCRNNPYGSNFLRPPQMRKDVPFLDMSIHIRRGDIMDGDSGAAKPEFADRYRPIEFYMDSANRLLGILNRITPTLPQQLVRITVYSEGHLETFLPLIKNFTLQGYHTTMNLDTKTSRVFAMLAESEINVLSVFSQFSNYYRIHLHHLRAGNDIIGLEHGQFKFVRKAPSLAAGFLFGDYAFDMADYNRVALLWYFIIEWKLRREEHLAACERFSISCLRANPYLFSPLGPVSSVFLNSS